MLKIMFPELWSQLLDHLVMTYIYHETAGGGQTVTYGEEMVQGSRVAATNPMGEGPHAGSLLSPWWQRIFPGVHRILIGPLVPVPEIKRSNVATAFHAVAQMRLHEVRRLS
jgi:hypothetical protein